MSGQRCSGSINSHTQTDRQTDRQTDMESAPELPSVTNTEECGICYLDFGAGRKAQSLAACGHVMCTRCLQHLLGKDGTVTCPYCRAHSTVPSDDEDGSSVGSEKGRSPRSWFKRLYKKSRRRQDSLAHDDIRHLAIMSSYFF